MLLDNIISEIKHIPFSKILAESELSPNDNKKLSRLKSFLWEHAPFVAYVLEEKIEFQQDNNLKAIAGVGITSKYADKITLFYRNDFFAQPLHVILFIILHEIDHLFQNIFTRGEAMINWAISAGMPPFTKRMLHELVNVCADAPINESLLKKNIGGLKPMPPYPVITLSTTIEGKAGTLHDFILNNFGIDVKFEIPEKIDKTVVEKLFKTAVLAMIKSKMFDQKPPEKYKFTDFQPGHIIFDKKRNTYGQVVSVDPKTGQVKYKKLTKEDLDQIVNGYGRHF